MAMMMVILLLMLVMFLNNDDDNLVEDDCKNDGIDDNDIVQEGLQSINLSASMIKVQIKSKSICNKKKSPCKAEFFVQSIMDILMFQEWGELDEKYSI